MDLVTKLSPATGKKNIKGLYTLFLESYLSGNDHVKANGTINLNFVLA